MLAYDLSLSAEQRDSWLETKLAELIEACRQALSNLSLPKNFSRYWIACFLSDYRTVGGINFAGCGIGSGVSSFPGIRDHSKVGTAWR